LYETTKPNPASKSVTEQYMDLSFYGCYHRTLGYVLPDHPTAMNIFVFKTSVETSDQIEYLAPKLNALAGPGSWNFDLTDCDRILRIVSHGVQASEAAMLLHNFGFSCYELED
jgi:hypothetical protein